MEQETLNLIAELLKNQLRLNLQKIQPARTYDGRPKPVSGNYFSPLSNKINTSTLYASIENAVFWATNFDDQIPRLIIDFEYVGVDYWKNVEYGRRPGLKFPPVDAIRSWVQSKPALSVPTLSIEQRTYLAGRSIATYGIAPSYFIRDAINNSLEPIQTYLGEAAAQYFQKVIEDKLIIIQGEQ